MRNLSGITLAGWTILLAGASLLVWQSTKGGGSDLLFNIGVIMMICGSVLRLFANFRRGGPKAAPRKPPGVPPAP